MRPTCVKPHVVFGLFLAAAVFLSGLQVFAQQPSGPRGERSARAESERGRAARQPAPAPHRVLPATAPTAKLRGLALSPPRFWDKLAELTVDLAVKLLSGNEAHLLSENEAELLSDNQTELLSGNSPKLLSEISPNLLSGNEPELLSGNSVSLFSGNRVSILSGIKLEIHISNSGNNGAPGFGPAGPVPAPGVAPRKAPPQRPAGPAVRPQAGKPAGKAPRARK